MKLKKSDIPKVITLYKAGTSQKDIGLIFGVSGQIIGRYIRAAGIETCVGGYNESRSAIKKKHQEILARYNRGESLNAIARAMRMSVAGVSYVIDKNFT